MKFSLFVMAFALINVLPLTAQAFDDTRMPTLKTHGGEAPYEQEAMKKSYSTVIKAVAFHSDSCGSCKVIGPRITEALEIINPNKVEMVKFDFTNKQTIEETKSLAIAKDVDPILQKFGARTGWIALVNSSGEVVDKIKVDHDIGEMAAKLAVAIANAS